MREPLIHSGNGLGSMMLRITSYNVCYTKLLRLNVLSCYPCFIGNGEHRVSLQLEGPVFFLAGAVCRGGDGSRYRDMRQRGHVMQRESVFMQVCDQFTVANARLECHGLRFSYNFV